MNDGLGIAMRAIPMALRFQLAPQLLMVVDLSVVNNPDVVCLVGDGLMAGLDIDDAEPPHSQTKVLLHEKSFVIRTTIDDLMVHDRQNALVHPLLPVFEKTSANP